ncbi:hypothetical protein SSYIS1_24560 [Serratia symbiotica]|uniref:Uncharacterized protein n=1 Tax=Serratia symbiotica TaxID=138074 RepID=A0A455VM73_9GAMM|nr:hypothetical protein SSYIS1_24560 [Serratia symbiotica]
MTVSLHDQFSGLRNTAQLMESRLIDDAIVLPMNQQHRHGDPAKARINVKVHQRDHRSRI